MTTVACRGVANSWHADVFNLWLQLILPEEMRAPGSAVQSSHNHCGDGERLHLSSPWTAACKQSDVYCLDLGVLSEGFQEVLECLCS